MKTSITKSPLRILNALGLAIVLAASHSGTANADVLASYSNLDAPSNNPVSPNNWGDFVEEPSLFTGAPGSGIIKENNQFYSGWSSSIDQSKYVGFTLTPMDGYQITVTDMSFRTRPSDTIITTSFVWGYRIDEGAGFSQWNFGSIWNPETPNYFSSFAKTWDIPDFTTTGTVEFGLFATAPTAAALMETRTVQVNGTMAEAVPEPSTYALLGLSAVVAFFIFRRRHAAAR